MTDSIPRRLSSQTIVVWQFNLRQLLATIFVASVWLCIGTSFGVVGVASFGCMQGTWLMCLAFRHGRLTLGNVGFAMLMSSIALGAVNCL